jgi:hypothetical protein
MFQGKKMRNRDTERRVHVHAPGVVFVALAALAVAGCGGGGGGGSPPPPPVAVTVTPANMTVKVDQAQQFSATVTGSSNTAVNWSVAGAGCTGVACGIVSATGLYTAPAIVPVPPTVNVTATAQADTSKSAAATVTLASDVALEVWPRNAKVSIRGSRQFLRMLTGNANAAVTWSVSCGVGDCGSVSNAGVYTAPAAVPNPAAVTIRATSVVDRGKSATANIDVLSANVAKLDGTYAYLYRGVWGNYDGLQAGSFTANGSGVISNGVLESIVSPAMGGNRPNLAFAGSYTVGDDNRGTLTFVIPTAGTVTWASAITANGEKAYIQPFYDPSVRGTATLHKQDTAAFNDAAINGDYVFQFDGANAGGSHVADVGRFSANGAGTISGGLIDSNDGATLTQNVAFTGSYGVATNGRGTMQFTIAGQTYNFALYVVSADTLIVVSTDTLAAGVPIRIGYALRQSGGPFANASLQGAYVFDLQGRTSGTAAVAAVGLLTGNGAGGIAGMLDRNDNNTITTNQAYTATYGVAANGRGTLASASLPQMIFYMVSPGRALLMDTGASLQTGSMERQLAAPYSTANLIGRFVTRSSPPALLNSVVVTGESSWTGQGTVPSTIDVFSPCGMNTGPSDGLVDVSAAGRFTVRFFNGDHMAAGYQITPGRYVHVLQRASAGPACDEVVHYYVSEQ